MSDECLKDEDLMLSEMTIKSLFHLAGFKVLKIWRLENQYWPHYETYDEIRKKSPWWLVRVGFPYSPGDVEVIGLIEIGWRKRVINIDWSETAVRASVTDDDVTKSETMVHAWSDTKALEYLKALAKG